MKKIIVMLVCLLAINSYAQKKPEKELGVWYTYSGSHGLSEKFSLKTFAHFRFFDQVEDFQQLVTRLGLNYKINKTFNATLGYSYANTDGTFGLDGGEVAEHRIYEDFNIKHNIKKLKLTHRFRGEHRFFKDNTSHWVRYELGLHYPLSEKWTGYIFNEMFLDFEGEAYNQNWSGLGVKYKLSESVKLQAGYIHINTANSADFDRLQVGIVLNTKHF